MEQQSKKSILVVDDDVALRNAIIFDFKRKGYNVLGAENGNKAFEVIRSQSIDLVLSDVRMPGGDGIELIERVKAFNPALPIVMFITGFTDMTAEEAYHRGAAAIFSKPFDRKLLMRTVEKALLSPDQVWAKTPERIKLDLSIELTGTDYASVVQGKILNIGRGGAFISIRKDLPKVGANLGFMVRFETGIPQIVQGEGTVKWVRGTESADRPMGVGIEFTQLSDQSRKEIVTLIEQSKMKSYIPIS